MIDRPIHKDGRRQLLLVGRLPCVSCSIIMMPALGPSRPSESGEPAPQARLMRLARRVEPRVPCECAEVQSTVLSTRTGAGISCW